jgi:hypothetical protein
MFLSGISFVWLIAALSILTDAGWDFFLLLGLLASGVILAITWIGITVAFLPEVLSAKVRLWWLSVPIIGAIGFSAAVAPDHALTLRVALSETSLIAYAKDAPAGYHFDQTQWVGLFHVKKSYGCNGAVYLYTGCGFLDPYGVAYMPQHGGPAQRIRIYHLYGPWYSFAEKF